MVNPLDMSDDDIMNMSAPPAPAGEGNTPEQVQDDAAKAAEAETARIAQEEADAETARVAAEQDGQKPTPEEDLENTPEGGATTTEGGNVVATDGEQAGKPAGTKEANTEGTQEVAAPKDSTSKDQTPDYEGFYKSALAPLKANGKEVEIKSPDDLRQLAQMGLNYTQKMQAIAPLRKVGLMLQDHGLLDETKLSFLIDLHNKKPEAIRQLVKDAGIDPLEIDTSAETGYTPGNHAVSDVEEAFRSKVQDYRSSPDGQATIDTINGTWDQASKQELWNKPEVIDVIHQHRSSGVYDRVAGEVNRLQALGQVPQNVSFLQAYHAVGQDMGKNGLLDDLVAPKVETPVQKQPIATRVVAKKADTNAAAVAAAGQTTTSSAKKADTKINPLDMSDAAFEAELKKVRGY